MQPAYCFSAGNAIKWHQNTRAVFYKKVHLFANKREKEHTWEGAPFPSVLFLALSRPSPLHRPAVIGRQLHPDEVALGVADTGQLAGAAVASTT